MDSMTGNPINPCHLLIGAVLVFMGLLVTLIGVNERIGVYMVALGLCVYVFPELVFGEPQPDQAPV